MQRYEPSTPRAALALAALAMTAASLGLLVVWPAEMDGYDEAGTWAMSGVVATASAGAVGDVATDDVAAAGAPATPAVQCTVVKTDRAPKT